MRIVLVTGTAYRDVVERVARALREKGYEAAVEVGDASVASLVSPGFVESVARRYGRDTLIILPPGVNVDARRVYEETGTVIVWGPSDPELLPELLERVRLEELEPGARLDSLAAPRPPAPASKPLIAEPCGLALHPRPPPVTILAEVMADHLDRSVFRLTHGVVIGFPRGVGRGEASRILDRMENLGVCWGVDTDNDEVILEAADRGATLILSVDPGRLELLSSLPPRRAVVLIPAGLGEKPPEPRKRVEVLAGLAEEARRHNLIPIIDALLAPPCLGLLESLEAYRLASKLGLPMLAGLGNVYELIDADATGVIGLLAALLVEAGVSVFLVTSESWKARRARIYAPIAAAMASIACSSRRPPKDLGLDLLASSEKRPSRLPSGWKPSVVLDAESLEVVRFERDPAGDNLVAVLGDELLVVHRWGDGRLEAIRSRDPRLLYRAALARGYATRLDHAAWLGFELGVAYTLAKLGRSYVSTGEPRIAPSEEEAEKALSLLSANPASRQRGDSPPQTP